MRLRFLTSTPQNIHEGSGTFAGIFGFMIQLGMVTINRLAPALLSGFTIALWSVPRLHWKWLFWVPPAIALLVAFLIVIAVAAGHRQDTFDACHYIIDRVKQIAPVWKREIGPGGASWVEGPESLP